jgi:nicotinamidase-related amidase
MSRLKNYTLIIIDMQLQFVSARNKVLINNIKAEIAHAQKLDNHIMFVRMANCGDIMLELLRATRGYSKTSIVTKDWQDGGAEVLAHLPSRKTHLRVCGVYTNLCVEDTVYSIAASYPTRFKIEIIAKCCSAGLMKTNHDRALERMEKETNIRIDRAV